MPRSRAEVIWSSAGKPFGLTKLDCVMPRRRAFSFIWSAKLSIEPPTPSASTTAMSFADFTSSILSALSTVTSGADREAHLDRLLRGGVRRDRHRGVERDAAFLDGAQRHVGRHQLGDGGRIPWVAGVLGVQHLAGVGLDQQQRFRRRRRCREASWRRARRPRSTGAVGSLLERNVATVAVRFVGRASETPDERSA